jgi:hypothetical protein
MAPEGFVQFDSRVIKPADIADEPDLTTLGSYVAWEQHQGFWTDRAAAQVHAAEVHRVEDEYPAREIGSTAAVATLELSVAS